MNKLQTARYNTYILRIKHLEDNMDITQRVPALVTAMQSAKAVVNAITITSQQLAAKTEGVQGNKENRQELLSDMAIVISAAISSYADMNGDVILREAMNFNRSELFYGPDQKLSEHSKNIMEKARELEQKLGDYGISPELISSYETAVNEYEGALQQPRELETETKQAGEKMQRLFAEAKLLFKRQVDKLVTQFKLTHRDYFDQYMTKKAIVDPYARKTRISGSVKEEVSGGFISGAVIKVVNADLSTTSDEEGNFSLEIPQTGVVAVTVSINGYKPVIASPFLKKGRNTKADIVLTAI